MKEIVYITAKDQLKETIREVLREERTSDPGIELKDRMTRREAATFMGVSYQTMHNYTKQGILKEHGAVRKKFYLRNELINAINGAK